MTYDLATNLDKERFKQRCNYLFEKKKRVTLTEKRYKRTLRQNKYFHLIAGWYGLEIGYTLEEVKQLIKRQICPDMFRYEKGENVFYKGTSDLNTKEMTIVIEIFRNHAARDGMYLPAPNEHSQLQSMQEQLEQYGNRQYV